jgi:hypothetical protein
MPRRSEKRFRACQHSGKYEAHVAEGVTGSRDGAVPLLELVKEVVAERAGEVREEGLDAEAEEAVDLNGVVLSSVAR